MNKGTKEETRARYLTAMLKVKALCEKGRPIANKPISIEYSIGSTFIPALIHTNYIKLNTEKSTLKRRYYEWILSEEVTMRHVEDTLETVKKITKNEIKTETHDFSNTGEKKARCNSCEDQTIKELLVSLKGVDAKLTKIMKELDIE